MRHRVPVRIYPTADSNVPSSTKSKQHLFPGTIADRVLGFVGDGLSLLHISPNLDRFLPIDSRHRQCWVDRRVAEPGRNPVVRHRVPLRIYPTADSKLLSSTTG